MFRFTRLLTLALTTAVTAQSQPPATIANPVIQNAADPFITRDHGKYLLLATHENTITIWAGPTFASLPKNPKLVWKPTDNMHQVWSPTLWKMHGNWWIYFTAEYPGGKHGIYVLESKTSDPLGEYTFHGLLKLANTAIDPSLLTISHKTYLMYVDVDLKGYNSIWITQLKDPMTPEGDGRQLIFPDQPWERSSNTTHNYPVAEGPTALYHSGKTFIVYSGSDTGTHEYCLGLFTYKDPQNGSADPTQTENWQKSGPVFSFSEEHHVYGPGRATFTTAIDNKQPWLIYHAKSAKEYTYAGRSLRMQPFTWNPDGTPNFGTPVAEGPLP